MTTKKTKLTKEQERIAALEAKVDKLAYHIKTHKLGYRMEGLWGAFFGKAPVLPISDKVDALAKHLGVTFRQTKEESSVIAVKPKKRRWWQKKDPNLVGRVSGNDLEPFMF